MATLRACVVLTLAAAGFVRAAPGKGHRAYTQVGMASYHADALAGRRTASGERYNPQKPTCAHRTLPFGTWLLVTVQKTGARARCRVNDRGPFTRGRVVDVSRKVARQLGLLRAGTARVRLQRVAGP